MSATEQEWRQSNGIAPDEGVSLVGEWWWISDPDGVVPTRMIWAGGRDIYDDAVRIATERFGVSPIAVPLSAFFPVPEPSEGPLKLPADHSLCDLPCDLPDEAHDG